MASPVTGPAAAAVPPPSPPKSLLLLLVMLLLLLLLLLLRCRYSLLRAFPKTQNEKQSVVTGCAPRCIAGREAAAAQQQHGSSSSSNSSGGGGGGGGAAAAATTSSSESRAGCCVASPLPSVCVCALSVCASLMYLVALVARFRPRDKVRSAWTNRTDCWSANERGAKFGPNRPLIWEVPGRFFSSSLNLVPSGRFVE